MKRALSEFYVSPVKTTIPLQMQILHNQSFARGEVDTGFVERELLGR
jgi:acetyl-CoA carboxylase biotin carboxylase subunit